MPRTKKPSAYRLSPDAMSLLTDLSKRTKMNKTEVIEAAILRHAHEFPDLREVTNKLMRGMFEQAGDDKAKK